MQKRKSYDEDLLTQLCLPDTFSKIPIDALCNSDNDDGKGEKIRGEQHFAPKTKQSLSGI